MEELADPEAQEGVLGLEASSIESSFMPEPEEGAAPSAPAVLVVEVVDVLASSAVAVH